MAKGFNQQQQELGRFRMTFHPVTEVKSCYKSVNFDGEQGLSQLACLSSLSLLKECDSDTYIFLIILGWSRKPANQEAGAWLDGLTYTEKVKLLGS